MKNSIAIRSSLFRSAATWDSLALVDSPRPVTSPFLPNHPSNPIVSLPPSAPRPLPLRPSSWCQDAVSLTTSAENEGHSANGREQKRHNQTNPSFALVPNR